MDNKEKEQPGGAKREKSQRNREDKMDEQSDLPLNVDEWTKDHVRSWVTKCSSMDSSEVEILYKQNVTGEVLNILSKKDFLEMGITFGSAKLISHRLKNLNIPSKDVKDIGAKCTQTDKDGAKRKQKSLNKEGTKELEVITTQKSTETNEKNKVENTLHERENVDHSHSKLPCTPYPFDRAHESKRYIQHYVLQPESGTTNYIDQVHEYKLFTNTENATEEDKKMKFCNEVFRFAAACMNARTNGTIHFGVSDKPHGEIIGIQLDNKETYVNYIRQMTNKYFEDKQLHVAQKCIRPPRFVDVLYQQNTQSDRVVIEVDVVPEHSLCNSEIFSTHQQIFTENKWKQSKEKTCFAREGESSRDMLANVKHNDADFKAFYSQTKSRDDARKRAEEEHKEKQKKKKEDGPKLVSLITGNRDILDNSFYKWYILVANKCHPSQRTHLDFMSEIDWFAVFDFDPESITNGLCKSYKEKRVPNLHFPNQYQDMDNATCEKLESLKLYQQTSWVFCNGRSDLGSQDYAPLSHREWQKEKAAEVRRLISFLSRKDILVRGKFLVVFLLLSPVEDPADPMNEVFSTFYQELSGMNDIVCICESEQTFQRWRDLQIRFVTAEEMEEKCIYNLAIENVNGTILKLKSVMQSSHRFLPSSGYSSIVLHRKDEDLMTSLDILCLNECQDTELEKNELEFDTFRKTQEEHFYRGGKASWWNFYFSMKSYSGPFIKRDIHDKLKDLIETWSQNDKQISVKMITLYHHPGCGGSTSAMHVLWELRKKFRCATLKRKTDSFREIANEVTNLVTYGSTNSADYFPALLLVDDYEEEENVYILLNSIRSVIAEKYIRYEKPVVLILNCLRSQKPEQSSKTKCTDSVALKHKLSSQEKRAFETKLKEIEQQHKKPEDFYSFMIMKSNFDQRYIENVVRNILKGLKSASKEAQLISFLALLNTYVKNSTISASMCEDFLGITAKKTFWGTESIEDKMGTYFTIILRTEVEEYGRYEGLRIIHPLIASRCIEELKSTYNMHKSHIILQLLNTNVFYDYGIGRELLLQNMQSMLITRHRKEHGDETDTLFSPLIEDVQKEEGSASVEIVLKEGTVRFNLNPYICQALARHFYIRDKNFPCALEWAKNAKKIAPGNSFVLDTLGQIYKTQLKSMMDKYNKQNILTAQELKDLLEIAVCASDAFRECQEQTEKTEAEREEFESAKSKRYNVYNTAGYLGQIEVCLCTIDILLQLPWFDKKNVLSRNHLKQYLSGKWDLSDDNFKKSHEDFHSVLSEFRYFLIKLKSHLKKTFDFFDDYFVYLKQRNILKEGLEFSTRAKVSKFFKKYRMTFWDLDLIQITDENVKVKGSISLYLEDYRACLESYKADKFSGILQYLTGHDKEKLEAIVKAYRYLLQHCTDTMLLRDKQNFILANIVLHCICPKSEQICPIKTLKQYLREILQMVGLEHQYSEPYFVAALLFWPHTMHQLDADSLLIEKYVVAMKKSFRGQYRHMCHSKQPIAHFYLGKNRDLKRLIHKGKIDQCFTSVPQSDLNSLWQCGDIWKEKHIENLLLRVHGRTENNLIYVECGNEERIKIPVRPVYLGQLRSGKSIERVSFYLGFSMDGLIAYDIESI
ncbi:sterile alpha motif domain-containing protein 9-like [Ascaphus truei]|uniref:sterile alpha motif domain-containing protein 9-like n=1 Tax=Ascaphus truei TaxID=8439 RepID=UPI003F5A1139